MSSLEIGIIVGAVVLAGAACAMVLSRRGPRCPRCNSREFDEWPEHYTCQDCGCRFEDIHRFGTYGGSDF